MQYGMSHHLVAANQHGSIPQGVMYPAGPLSEDQPVDSQRTSLADLDGDLAGFFAAPDLDADLKQLQVDDLGPMFMQDISSPGPDGGMRRTMSF